MTKKIDKPFLEVVNNPHKPKATKTGSGGGSGGTGKDKPQRFGDYAIIGNAFHQVKTVRVGRDDQESLHIPLCDFVYSILEEVIHDTGLEDQTYLRIEGRRNDGVSLPLIEVPAAKFYASQSNWPNEYWGASVFICTGTQKRENLRAAGQLYSRLKHEGDPPRRKVYKYAGWVKIEGKWHYLTGSGAITAEGLRQDIQVDLGQGHMSHYQLPTPVAGDELKPAAGLLSALLTICPGKPQIGAALLAAVARAPLGECSPIDFIIFLHGVTGSKKSSIAAVALAFFGQFDARRFPANFSDTDNVLEFKAHQAKDVVFVVDDFRPEGGQVEAGKAHAKAARYVRNTGNNAGRSRLSSDIQAKAAPYNRSLSILTGEDTLKGQSIFGRALTIEINRSDVDCSRLTQLQNAANAGALAGLMAAYLQWLAPRIDQLKRDLSQKIIEYRNIAEQSGNCSSHPRAPEMFASMVAGATIFTQFLESTGVIDSEQADSLAEQIEAGLLQAFSEQTAYQVDQDETERFLALLRALFSAGNAHIACRLNQGPPPTRPHAWGWRELSGGIGDKDYKPMGDCVGWICDKSRELWIEQNATFAAVQQLARAQGETFLMTPATLWRRLHDKGLIIKTEPDAKNSRPRLAVKRIIAGRNVRVMILSADLVESG